MKTKNDIGWNIMDAVGLILLISDLWTGKLLIDQWLRIVLASAIGAMLLFGILRRYARKERERTRAPKKDRINSKGTGKLSPCYFYGSDTKTGHNILCFSAKYTCQICEHMV